MHGFTRHLLPRPLHRQDLLPEPVEAVVVEEAEVEEVVARLPHRYRRPQQQMVMHPQPLQEPLHAVPVVVAEVVDVALPPQLQPTEPQLRLSLPQRVDAVAEVVVLLRPLQRKSFRKLPKVHWQLRCRSHPALEFSGPRKARDTPSSTHIEFHRQMVASALFLRRIVVLEIGANSGGSRRELPPQQTCHLPYLNFA